MDGNVILNELWDMAFTSGMNVRYYGAVFARYDQLDANAFYAAMTTLGLGALLCVCGAVCARRWLFAAGVVALAAWGFVAMPVYLHYDELAAKTDAHLQNWALVHREIENQYFQARLQVAPETIPRIDTQLAWLNVQVTTFHWLDPYPADEALLLEAYNAELKARTGFANYEELAASDWEGPHPKEEQAEDEGPRVQILDLTPFLFGPGELMEPTEDPVPELVPADPEADRPV